MSQRRSKLILALLLTITLGLVPACDRPGAEHSKVRLEFWTLALSPYFDDYIHDLTAGFEADHPGVDVVWVDVPFSGINRKLVAASAADRGPDVVNLSDRDFARVAALGGLQPLGDQLPPGAESAYLPGAMRVLELDGKLLALPWYLTTPIRMCDKALLAKGGLTPEGVADTWAGLRKQARAYHDRTGGFLFSLPLGEDSELPIMMLANGTPPFREVRDNGNPRLVADLTRPEIVEMVGDWVALFREGALPRAAATRDHSHIVELYQNGQIAVAQTGANMLGRVRDANPKVFAQTRLRRAVTGSLGHPHIALMTLAVTRSSAHPCLAAELAAWVSSPKHQTQLAKRSGVLPSTSASLDDPYFAPPAQDAQASPDAMVAWARSVTARSLPHAIAFTPALETWPDLRRSFNQHIKAALLDGADVEQTLAATERDWDRILAASRPATAEALPPTEPAGSRSREAPR